MWHREIYRIVRTYRSSLRRRMGRLLFAGFGGQQVPVELGALAQEFGLGGVILLARNVR